MPYDPNQLKSLRDDIDRYLTKTGEEDMHIYDALEKSISKSVVEGLKPLLDDFKAYLDKKIDTK
jgi:hypothetical protein